MVGDEKCIKTWHTFLDIISVLNFYLKICFMTVNLQRCYFGYLENWKWTTFPILPQNLPIAFCKSFRKLFFC